MTRSGASSARQGVPGGERRRRVLVRAVGRGRRRSGRRRGGGRGRRGALGSGRAAGRRRARGQRVAVRLHRRGGRSRGRRAARRPRAAPGGRACRTGVPHRAPCDEPCEPWPSLKPFCTSSSLVCACSAIFLALSMKPMRVSSLLVAVEGYPGSVPAWPDCQPTDRPARASRVGHRAQRPRARGQLRVGQLVPFQRRRHRRALDRPHGVGRDHGLPVGVAGRVDEDLPVALLLAPLGRQRVRRAPRDLDADLAAPARAPTAPRACA